MCGIVLLSGPRAATRLERCLVRLRHRGPDDLCTWVAPDLAIGFARLVINGDLTVGRQPHHHRHLIGVVNGEIYNHRSLSESHGLEHSECDSRVVLPLFDRIGQGVIDEIDGFFSAVVVDPVKREAICLRDRMGKKPLFVGRSSSEVFITSELKVLDACDDFELLPRGVARVDLNTGTIARVTAHRPLSRGPDLEMAFKLAVSKRVPGPGQPVGVFLSGGLDSSLVATFVSQIRHDATYFTLGSEAGADRGMAAGVIEKLGLRNVQVIPLPKPEEVPALVSAVVHATESFNPSIVSNGLATYLLARAAREAGIKVVLTGDGADELFGGYHLFGEQDPWSEVRARLVDDMQFTELRRLDLSCMAHGVEPRCPFLDRAVCAISEGLSFREMYDGGANKVALRRCFEGVLPPEILHRRKVSFDVGSGTRAEVVRFLRRNGGCEREELRKVWATHFPFDGSNPYFHAYPVFDAAIDRRGESHR